MIIEVQFVETDTSWDDYIRKNAKRASEAVSDPKFIEKVRAWPRFDYTKKSSSEIANIVKNAGTVKVKVGYYTEGGFVLRRVFRTLRNRTTRAIAAEGDGIVRFNRRKKFEGAGSPGNIAHETMHVLGFSHNGNDRNGNENTVPYRIGEWVDDEHMPWAMAVGER